ncbi:hypothetical protein [Reichenbachiella sp.]|uniref:hypothetical protein n=1 Tax=Reichenbachiella sp. TaxID=2184521 RepID=UPI003BAF874C
MNLNSYIIVAGPNEDQLKSALLELANMYSETGFTKEIGVYKSLKSENQYIINFTEHPDFERFKYFVNYLNYQEASNYSAKTMGYWTLSSNDKLPKQYNEKRILLYVSDKDEEGDNVYGIIEGEGKTLKLGFAMGEEFSELDLKEIEFSEPSINEKDFEHCGSIRPDFNSSKAKSNSGCALMILALIVSCLTSLILLR